MSDPAECQILGRWRILESDQWDRDYLDLIDPAFIAFATDGHGELAFGVVTVSLRLEYAHKVVFFTFEDPVILPRTGARLERKCLERDTQLW